MTSPAGLDRYGAVVLEMILTPAMPYSLAQSAWGWDPSRRFAGGVLEMVFAVDRLTTRVRAWQRPDGRMVARLEGDCSERAVARLRFMLAVDDDHGPFLAAAKADPLLGPLVSQRTGLRPVRTSTVAHSLVKALAGQLITAREARLIEHRVLARCHPSYDGLLLAPTGEDLRRLSAAELSRTGLAPRRAGALARVVRTLDVERLRAVPTAAAVARLGRERTLGPWSAGVIALYGLGRYEHGMVGDLGLIRLCSHLLGRPATAADTARLLESYGDWAGLASVHLIRHPLARQRPALAA